MEADNIKLEILDDINFSNAGYLLRILPREGKNEFFSFPFLIRNEILTREKIIWLVFQTERKGNNLNAALRSVG